MRSSWKCLYAALVFAVGLAGSPAHAVEVAVSGTGHAYNPTWSQDGRWLAFELNDYEGNIDLYVVEVSGGTANGVPREVQIPGAKSNFASRGGVAYSPTWHPQGALIFEASNAGGTNRLYLLTPGGQSAGELITATQIRGDLTWPAVSNDGRSLVFVSDATGNGDLYVWDKSSNTVNQAMTSPFSETAPKYSDDGLKVAYSRKNRGGEDLFVWASGRPSPMVGGNGDQTRPIWNNNSVVFFTNERGEDRWDIAISSGVGNKRIIARDVRLPVRATPALSPDGRWVAYGVSDPNQASKLHFVRVDGSQRVSVETGLVACGEPALMNADGRTFLAFTALPSQGADWRKLHIKDVTGRLP